MLNDTDAGCVVIAVSVCLRKEKRKFAAGPKDGTNEDHNTHTNLMKDLRLSRPNDYKRVVVGLSII
jgi:hypothetical protein